MTSNSDASLGIDKAQGKCVLWWNDGVKENAVLVGPQCRDLSLQMAARSREAPNYPGRIHVVGDYWFVSTGKSVRHESSVERDALRSMDRTGTVAGIAAQPFCLTFPGGTKHFPDFFVVLKSRERIIVDVRPFRRIEESDWNKFLLTEQVADRIGWHYMLMDEIIGHYKDNLEWMQPYKKPRYRPSEEAGTRIMKFLEQPRSFGWMLGELSKAGPANLGNLYHLMWTSEVVFDESRQLTEQQVLRAASRV